MRMRLRSFVCCGWDGKSAFSFCWLIEKVLWLNEESIESSNLCVELQCKTCNVVCLFFVCSSCCCCCWWSLFSLMTVIAFPRFGFENYLFTVCCDFNMRSMFSQRPILIILISIFNIYHVSVTVHILAKPHKSALNRRCQKKEWISFSFTGTTT